jgi:TaqI-like C-terminal specificity domain/Eco57I restriction-modification methylase
MSGAWVYCELPRMIASQPVSTTRIAASLNSLTNTQALKELFYNHLKYDRVDTTISARTLPESVRANLKGSKMVLLAQGGARNKFDVIYTQLNSQQIRKQEQRGIIDALLTIHPYSLFVFSNQDQDDWHFINAKYDDQATQRRLLRRMVVNQREQLRTAIEQISELDLQFIGDSYGKGITELEPLEIQTQHDKAFDVEKVTDKFFDEYKLVFQSVEGSIEGIKNPEQKRLFTQKLFNRLMFIAFVQKKGWLDFNGSKDYFKALWLDYKKSKSVGNFYSDRLSHLFFKGLNDLDRQGDKKLIGDVPYLNGGLFEEDASEMVPGIVVPDGAIEKIFKDLLFDKFNFTVSESTPLDVDVAVDPEMLGKVFEELVTDRHGSGSYYTPKPIVAFMCRETLKGYLKSKCAEDGEVIDRFVDDHDSQGLSDPEAVLNALKVVTVCDPACGSGAYLLGMMHELLELRACLFVSDKLGQDSVYARKLEIIENNLYGVDKELFAVSIARLRLWLSLAVDFEGDKPQPLPNLKYKLEVGDSLLAPVVMGQGLLRDDRVKEFQRLKSEYLAAHGQAKKASLEKAIDDVKEQISLITHGRSKVNGFDWVVNFAEVMMAGGFDIQVANPPYVRMELFKEIKPTLKKNFPEAHSDRADLYCYFYARSLQLLKHGGMIAFISSNKWFKAGYGEKLRQHIGETCHIHSITDFCDLPVFKSATAYPMIFICSTQSAKQGETVFTEVKSLRYPYPNIREIIHQIGSSLPSDAISGKDWLLTDTRNYNRIRQMDSTGITLSEYINGEIYWGVKTGLNSAFVIDGRIRERLISEDSANKDIIKSLVIGDDVRKWHIKEKDTYLLYMYHGINVKGLDSAINYLKPYRQKLEARATKQKWYELQQPQMRFSTAFNKPKIIYPEINQSSRFTFDNTGTFINNKAFIIPTDDLYLLGVLNSAHIWNYLKTTCSPLQGQTFELRTTYMSKIPIPKASEIEQKAISKLVQKCLDSKGVGCEAWEKEIDVRVAKLYGLEDNYDLN